MRIGVVRTAESPCRCAESVSVGLRTLNHEPFIVDSQDIEHHVQELAENCDLVIDHTDTYGGRGLYRSFVRLLLEGFGARVLGSSSQACFTADNKVAAKALLSDAGIPVPPGIVIQSDAWSLPEWLKPPLVLKPAFEHMSRGVRLAHSEQETYEAATQLLASLRQPILVEAYIAGRELAVSLLNGPTGIQVLPVLEWKVPRLSQGILTEDFKLMDPADDRHAFLRADMALPLQQELESLSLHAFRRLNLRDYARFDIRLSSGGTLYFLEANTTPSLEPLEALASSAGWAGLDYTALVERLLWNARHRAGAPERTGKNIFHIPVRTEGLELQATSGSLAPPASTLELADRLDVQPGEKVLELGCGSGLLSIAAAKLGASRVVATDLSPHALQATRDNAVRSGVGHRIEIRAGSWYEALIHPSLFSSERERFHVIIATPPQTPGRHHFGPKYGGPDGLQHLRRVVRGSVDHLTADGRLWLLVISLADTRELWKDLHERFAEVSLIHQTKRSFMPSEYESIDPGLFEYLRSLRASGISDFVEEINGQYFFYNLFIRASKPQGADETAHC